jgi:hypothetical protein
MLNNKGFSIMLVLLLLGIISILGSAFMMMSRLDLNFTGAMKNYDKLFNLADGACGMGYNKISRKNPVDPGNWVGTNKASEGPFYNQLPEQNIGTYTVTLWFQGMTPSDRKLSGEQIGEKHGEYWTGEGRANKFTGSIMVEAAVFLKRAN